MSCLILSVSEEPICNGSIVGEKLKGEQLDDLKNLVSAALEAAEADDQGALEDIAYNISLLCDFNGLGDDYDTPYFLRIIIDLPESIQPALLDALQAIGKTVGLVKGPVVNWLEHDA